MDFEWDEEKNTINKRKHGIAFEDAIYIFSDPFRIEIYDREHSGEEDRFKVIGKVGQIIAVIYTERQENTRIISARYAVKSEKEAYYGNCKM